MSSPKHPMPITVNILLSGGAAAALNCRRKAYLSSWCSCQPEKPVSELQGKLLLLEFCWSSELDWTWLCTAGASWGCPSDVFSQPGFPAVSHGVPINAQVCLVFHHCGLVGSEKERMTLQCRSPGKQHHPSQQALGQAAAPSVVWLCSSSSKPRGIPADPHGAGSSLWLTHSSWSSMGNIPSFCFQGCLSSVFK